MSTSTNSELDTMISKTAHKAHKSQLEKTTNVLDDFLASQFGKLIIDKSSVIYQQIGMLVNTKITQMVNTGDRIQDGIYIGLLNTLFALVMSGLYQLMTLIYHIFKVTPGQTTTIATNNTGPVIMDTLLQQYNQVDIEKYTYSVPLSSVSDKVISDYVLNHHIVDRIHAAGTMTCELRQNQLTVTSKESMLFVPVYRYLHSGTTFYVFFIKGKLYGMHMEALRYVTTALAEFMPVQTGQTRKLIIAEYCGQGSTGSGYYIEGGPEGGSKIAGFTRQLGIVNQKATFDRIFFTDKPVLLTWLYKFENNLMYPPELCLSNKFAVLLYGPPGTGKTGVVSAMANHLGRHVVSINSLLLDASKKNDMTKHINEAKATSIILFDEFDYLLCAKPETQVDTDAEDAAGTALADELFAAKTDAERDAITKKYREMRTKSTTNVAFDKRFLLRLLDGQGDDAGRCVVMNTNHPELIDKDLMRPGRIDLKIELGFCSRRIFWEIVDKVYYNLLPDVLQSIPDEDVVENAIEVVEEDNTETTRDSVNDPVLVDKEDADGKDADGKDADTNDYTKCLPSKKDVNLKLVYVDPLIKYARAEFTCKNTELQQRVDAILSLNITPLVLINKLVATPSFGQLLVDLENCPQTNYGYGNIKW
jgi:hypothetical protein